MRKAKRSNLLSPPNETSGKNAEELEKALVIAKGMININIHIIMRGKSHEA